MQTDKHPVNVPNGTSIGLINGVVKDMTAHNQKALKALGNSLTIAATNRDQAEQRLVFEILDHYNEMTKRNERFAEKVAELRSLQQAKKAEAPAPRAAKPRKPKAAAAPATDKPKRAAKPRAPKASDAPAPRKKSTPKASDSFTPTKEYEPILMRSFVTLGENQQYAAIQNHMFEQMQQLGMVKPGDLVKSKGSRVPRYKALTASLKNTWKKRGWLQGDGQNGYSLTDEGLKVAQQYLDDPQNTPASEPEEASEGKSRTKATAAA